MEGTSFGLKSCYGLISRIVSSLVTAQPALFLSNLTRWLAIAIPATYTNSMLEYLQSELGLAYRTRLTRHALSTYLDPPAESQRIEGAKEGVGRAGDDGKGEQLFYKLANLDDRIKNADQVSRRISPARREVLIDQYLTVDIHQFSNKLAEIYSNIAKPVLDVMCVMLVEGSRGLTQIADYTTISYLGMWARRGL